MLHQSCAVSIRLHIMIIPRVGVKLLTHYGSLRYNDAQIFSPIGLLLLL